MSLFGGPQRVVTQDVRTISISSLCTSCSFRAEPVSQPKEFHDQRVGVKAAVWLWQKSKRISRNWNSNFHFKSHISDCHSEKGNPLYSRMALLQLPFSHRAALSFYKMERKLHSFLFWNSVSKKYSLAPKHVTGSFLHGSSLAPVPAKDKLLLF